MSQSQQRQECNEVLLLFVEKLQTTRNCNDGIRKPGSYERPERLREPPRKTEGGVDTCAVQLRITRDPGTSPTEVIRRRVAEDRSGGRVSNGAKLWDRRAQSSKPDCSCHCSICTPPGRHDL